MKTNRPVPKEEDIFHFMFFVYRKLSKPFEDYFKGEFTSLQLNALCILCTDGPITMGGLAASLHTPPQQMSRMIEKLYEGGHIVRSTDPADRRKVLISLSDSTYKRILKGREKFAAAVIKEIQGLNEDDYSAFKDAVKVINRILTDIPE